MMEGELREKLAEAIANAEAEAGYNWYWADSSGEIFPKWSYLPEEDEECGSDHWVRGRNYFRMRAAVDLAVITEYRAQQREAFERAVDELIAHAIGFGTSGREVSKEQTAAAKRAVMQAAGYGEW